MTKKAIVNGNKIFLRFKYDENILKVIKSFRFRRWNGQEKTWEVTVTDRLEVFKMQEVLRKHDFKVEVKKPLSLHAINEVELLDDKPELRLFIHPSRLPGLKNLVEKFKNFITFEDRKFGFYKIFLSKVSLELIIQLIEKEELFVSPEMKQKIFEKYESFLREIEKSQSTFSEFDVPELKKKLYPFQRAGVQYLVEKGRVLLADEMGLGKTIQAIAAIVYQRAFSCLVISPASLKYNWEKEVLQTTDHTVCVIDTKKPFNYENCNTDFVIINYDILGKYLDRLKKIPFKSLIVDESHYVKNKKAKRTQAVKEIAREVKERNGKIYLLTGTPVLNKPDELIPQLEVLDMLKWIVRNELQFRIRYCGGYKNGKKWYFRGASNLQELREKLRSTCMIRRHKKDVLSDLPEKTRSLINFEVYDENYFELEWEYEEAGFEEKIGYIPRLYRASGIAKIYYALDWVDSFYENFSDISKKLVIFAYHQDVQNTLYDELSKKYEVLKLTSDMKTEERHQVVEKFQSDPNVQIIVVSLRVGGEGITLTTSDTALMVEPYWVPATLQQAEDRLHRISQKSKVSVYYLLAQNTIDVAVWNIMSEKEKIFNELTKGIKLTPEQEKKIKEMTEVIKRYLQKLSQKKSLLQKENLQNNFPNDQSLKSENKHTRFLQKVEVKIQPLNLLEVTV